MIFCSQNFVFGYIWVSLKIYSPKLLVESRAQLNVKLKEFLYVGAES